MLPIPWYLWEPHAELKALVADDRPIDGPVLQDRVAERRELVGHGMVVFTFQQPLVYRIALEADVAHRLVVTLASTTQ